MGHILIRMKRNVRASPISVDDYLRNKMLQSNRSQTGKKLCEVIDHFTMLNQHGYLNNLEMEGKK